MTETELTAGEQALANANLDQHLASQNLLLEQIAEGIASARRSLADAGFEVYKHYELRHPQSGLVFAASYASGEYQATITGLPAGPSPVTFRLTKAQQERDPMAVARLTQILLNINAGAQYQVYIGAGNVVYGIWSESGDPEGEGLLFGETYTESAMSIDSFAHEPVTMLGEFDDEGDADDEVDPAERAQLELDEGPPDMSGPGNPSGEGR